MRRALLLLAFSAALQAQNLTMGWNAALTSWNTQFTGLQTPGWDTSVHPGGIIDLQYKSVYAELGGDPHRPREATSIFIGLRHDLFHKSRFHVYGQVAAGVFEAPSFLEYCGSYEYRDGNCGVGAQEPEYCFWGTVAVGYGLRVQVTKKFALEPARAEYVVPYAISPRWRLSAGFRVGL